MDVIEQETRMGQQFSVNAEQFSRLPCALPTAMQQLLYLPVYARHITQNWPRRQPCVRLGQLGPSLIETLDRLVADVARSYSGRQAGRILLHRDRCPVRRPPGGAQMTAASASE